MTWQPIETAPKDGTTVDLWHRKHGRITDAWWDTFGHITDAWVDNYGGDNQEGWIAFVGDEGSDFTHWMPIPLPPDKEWRGEYND